MNHFSWSKYNSPELIALIVSKRLRGANDNSKVREVLESFVKSRDKGAYPKRIEEFDCIYLIKCSIIKENDIIRDKVADRIIENGFRLAIIEIKELEDDIEKLKNDTGNTICQYLIDCINEQANKYLQKECRHYTLVTTTNIAVDCNNQLREKVNNCYLHFYEFLPKRYKNARLEGLEKVGSWLIDKDKKPSAKSFLVVSTWERCEYSAGEKMLEAIDLMRGIWNLSANPLYVDTLDPKAAVNRILLSPFHTLHRAKGKELADSYWYQVERRPNQPCIIESKIIKKDEKIHRVKKSLESCTGNYRKKVEKALVTYVRALDIPRYDIAFTEMWKVLESLARKNEREDSTKMVKRISILTDSYLFHKSILFYLKSIRDNLVHTPSDKSKTMYSSVYRLQEYARLLLRYYICKEQEFTEIEQMIDHLDSKLT